MSFFSKRSGIGLAGLAVFWLMTAASLAQSAKVGSSEPPLEADGGFLQSQGAQPRFEAATKVSADTQTAIQQDRILSVPHFSGSFNVLGQAYSYTMVGEKPQAGRVTTVPTQIIPIALLFEGFHDENGAPIVLDPTSVMPRVDNSPNFHKFAYQTGFTQYADAIQRAEFFASMGQDWHTLLGQPDVLKTITIDVPPGAAKVFRNRTNGQVYAVVDSAFFISHLNTIIQLVDLKSDGLPIALTSNVLLAPESDLKRCCVLGFHTSFDGGSNADPRVVQTFIWASWMDAGILGTNLADVTPMSHEISEWMNDPFGANLVPAWQIPLTGGCQNTLETADPVAALPNSSFPVPIDGFTYHPQSQVLLQWFQRAQTSDAIDGAFSFPDESLMRSPSQACAAQ